MTSKMRYYSASLISKYTGYNKYVNPKKEILELINPDPNKDLNLIQLKLTTLLNSESNQRDITMPTTVESLNKFSEQNNENEVSDISLLSDIIGVDPSYVQSSLNCFYGSSNEINVINLIKEKYGYDIVENNNKCYSMFIKNNIENNIENNQGIKICGRIDGFTYVNGEKYLVEIKSRKNRLFSMMPIYEKVQILLYTKLCDCNKVIYIQNHGTQLSLEIFNNFTDDKLYNEVIQRLKIVDKCVNGENIDELCYWF